MVHRPLQFTFAFVCLCTLIFATMPAQAYIDAGTGSYIFQIVIASIVAGAFIFKSFLGRIIGWFTRKPAPTAEAEQRHE